MFSLVNDLPIGVGNLYQSLTQFRLRMTEYIWLAQTITDSMDGFMPTVRHVTELVYFIGSRCFIRSCATVAIRVSICIQLDTREMLG